MDFKYIFENFDEKRQKYGNKINKLISDPKYDFSINRSSIDMNYSRYTITDKTTNKKLYTGIIHYIATYDENLSIWQWSWSLPYLHKSDNYKARDILKYAFDIDNYINIDNNNVSHNRDIYINSCLKAELLNSKLYLEHQTLDINRYIALSIYLTKCIWFIEMPYYVDVHTFAGLINYYLIESFDEIKEDT